MRIFSTDPDRAAEKAARKQAEHERREREEAEAERRREEREFWDSAAGRARRCFERGDQIFQAVMVLDRDYVGSSRRSLYRAQEEMRDSDSADLTAIAAEGWDLHSSSTAFVIDNARAEGPPTGLTIDVQGKLVGTYVFVRRP